MVTAVVVIILLKEAFSGKDASFAKPLYVFAIFCGVLSTTLIKFTGISQSASVNQIIFLRSAFACVLLLPFCRSIKFELRKLHAANNMEKFIFLGLQLCSILSSYCWHTAIQQIPVNNATIISFISPIATSAIAAIILKERPSKTNIVGLLINFFAIFMLYRFSENRFKFGYILIILDVIFFYSFIAIANKKLNNLSALFLTWSRFAILTPISYIFTDNISKAVNCKSISILFCIAVLTLTQRFFFTLSYKKTQISSLQHLKYFSIVFSILLTYLILREKPSRESIFASIVILVSQLYIFAFSKKGRAAL